MSAGFQDSPLVRQLLSMEVPLWEDLPSIDLYMDQLLGYINRQLSAFQDRADLPLTKSMVNNYVKMKIIPAPVNKKYQRQHVALLLLLCGLKKVFSIPECVQIIRMVSPSGVLRPKDYNACCKAMEAAMQASFGSGDRQPPADVPPMLYRAVMACTDKLYLQKYMDYLSGWQ